MTKYRVNMFYDGSSLPQCVIFEIAEAHFAGTGSIECGSKAQKIVSDVVVIARDFHGRVEAEPVFAVRAVMNRHDVTVVPDADVK